MSEYTTVWQAFLAMIGLSTGCLFYALGGRSNKWLRRFIASFIIAATVNGLCLWRGLWNPWMLAVYPILVLGFLMGYGGNNLWYKVVRRTLCAIAILSAGLLMAILLGGKAWGLFIPHVGVGLWSVWLGVKNPIEAAGEETLICAALNLFLVFYPFCMGIR